MPTVPITVVELPVFLRQAAAVWNEADRSEFVDHIARNAEAGDLIPDTGGVRKIRWQRRGMGKRGGVRVVYFYHNQQMPLFLLLVYAKSQRVDMTADEKKIVRAMAMTLKRSYGWKG
jgi:hypothetical protein